MLILIFTDVQYFKNVVLSIKKGLTGTKSLFVRFPPSNEKNPLAKFPIPHQWREFPPYLLLLFRKSCMVGGGPYKVP